MRGTGRTLLGVLRGRTFALYLALLWYAGGVVTGVVLAGLCLALCL